MKQAFFLSLALLGLAFAFLGAITFVPSNAWADCPYDFETTLMDEYAESIGVHHAWEWQYSDTVRLFEDLYKEEGLRVACCDSCGSPRIVECMQPRHAYGRTYNLCEYCRHLETERLEMLESYEPIRYGHRTKDNKLHEAALKVYGERGLTENIERAIRFDFPELLGPAEL